MLKWSILYSDWAVFDSSQIKWDDLPSNNVIKVIISSDSGEMVFSGWDVYWLLEIKDGLKVGVWKDDDLEDPFYHKGQERIFKLIDNKVEVSDLEYKHYKTWNNIPLISRKRGIWVDDETAKKMGIL